MNCPTCSAVIANGAKFCPRCGGSASATPRADERLPSSAPIPRRAWVFMLAFVVGPAFVLAGWWLGLVGLLWIGVAILALLALVAILGDLF